MEINTIVNAMSRHEYAIRLAPAGGTVQGTALPTSGLKRRPRPTTFGTDSRPRTP